MRGLLRSGETSVPVYSIHSQAISTEPFSQSKLWYTCSLCRGEIAPVVLILLV